MGERHDAEREIAQTRARLSGIAEELSRRATPDYVRERARERVDDIKTRASAKARERSMEMREKAMENPWVLATLGGTLGLLAGKIIGNKAKDRYERTHPPSRRVRSYEFDETSYQRPGSYQPPVRAEGGVIITEDEMYGLDTMGADVRDRTNYDVESERARLRAEQATYGEQGGGRFDKVKGLAETVKHKAEDVRHKASDRYSHMRESRGQTMHHLKERSHDMSGRAKEMVHTSGEHPSMLGLGAIAAGVLAGLFLPVTRRERRTIGPAKQKVLHKAEEQFRNVREQAMDRVQELEHKVKDVVKEEIAGGLSGKSGRQEEQRRGEWREGGGYRTEGDYRGGESRGREYRSEDETGGDYRGKEFRSPGETGGTGEYRSGESSEFSERRGTYSASEEGSEFTPTPKPDITRH